MLIDGGEPADYANAMVEILKKNRCCARSRRGPA
jgi:hypothetical protein